ncbi:L,D-transpeptidase family protein [Thermomonas flagellata]|uniref:L,D-transpeptidase family protein n=1 Tax=Thermomonas flagellata TaxID=2888524 RepID=UPI001F042182|nr:hypothetical protein [Thermomonas flagellata]
MRPRRSPALLLSALLPLLLAACAPRTPLRPEAARWANAGQLVLVTSADWDSPRGQLQRFERVEGQWRPVAAPVPVMLGRSGSAWGLGLHTVPADGPHKREGDGRAPAGVFALGPAFGYAPQAATGLPYRAMGADDWCIDVPDSPLYNRIVDRRTAPPAAVAGATEPMRRDLHADGDLRYREGFVILHNPQAVAGAGSCIFAHLWRAPDETTAGCTAMAPESMQALLAWLDARRHPVFVLLPQAQYRTLWAAWGLPAPAGAVP